MRPALATCFIAFIAVSVAAGKLPFAVLVLYLGVSLVTFVFYAIDKSAACNDRRRTPERVLHLLSVLGGWPGALIAQRILHHKWKKQSFLALCWTTVLLNCGALVCLVLNTAPSP